MTFPNQYALKNLLLSLRAKVLIVSALVGLGAGIVCFAYSQNNTVSIASASYGDSAIVLLVKKSGVAIKYYPNLPDFVRRGIRVSPNFVKERDIYFLRWGRDRLTARMDNYYIDFGWVVNIGILLSYSIFCFAYVGAKSRNAKFQVSDQNTQSD